MKFDDRTIGFLTLLFSAIGGFISLYLWNASVTASEIICNTGCESVITGDYGKLMGVPIAFLGFVYYVVLSGLVIIRLKLSDILLDRLMALVIGGGILFTLYLRYLEFFVIGDICIWCWGSALMVALIFLLFVIQVRGRVKEILGLG